MSFTKNDQAVVLNKESLQYLANCIRLVHSLPDLLNDVLPSQTTTYSSYKVAELLNTLNTDLQNYVNSALGNLSHLKKEVVPVVPTNDNADEDTIYLVKDASGGYEQYLKINGVVTSLGSTSAINNVYTKTESDAKFALLSTLNSLITTVGGLNDLTTTDKTSIVNAINELKSDKVNKTDIVDNLTSTDTDKPLSANQGKVLKDKVDTKANNSEVVKKTDVNTSLTSTPSTGKVYDANTINKIINTLNYNYNSDTDIKDIAVRKNAIIHALNDLNNSYNGVTNVNLPYATFVIRYKGGYYNTYILTAYGNNHTVEILEYSPYENYLNIWDISGGNFDSLTLRKSSQIFYNKDPYKISYTFTDETNYKLNTLTYSIRNGICYMRVEIKCVTPASGYSTVGSISNMGIPVPEVQEYKKLFDIVGNSMCGFYIGSGYIQMMGGTAGRTYQGSFSYPIKI